MATTLSEVRDGRNSSPMGAIGGALGIRENLVPFFNKKMQDESGEVSLHIFFERLDARRDFEAMLTLLVCKEGGRK